MEAGSVFRAVASRSIALNRIFLDGLLKGKPPAAVGPRPVGPDLLVHLEAVAAQLRQRGPEPAQQPGVFGALVLGHDVTVGLEKHYCYVPSEGSAGRTPRGMRAHPPDSLPWLTTLAPPPLEFARPA